jgi:hypothetical protein
MTQEIWRTIENFPNYEVSNLGNVKSTAKGIILSPCMKNRYLAVCLHNKPVKKTMRIHKLVMNTFVGIAEGGIQVNHKNGIKTDNRLENLEYTTPLQNVRHSLEIGLRKRSLLPKREPLSRRPRKLKPENVREIRLLLSSGKTNKFIAEQFGVSHQIISSIKVGRRWSAI